MVNLSKNQGKPLVYMPVTSSNFVVELCITKMIPMLDPIEKKVLYLIVQEYSDEEISETLQIHKETFIAHRDKLYEKLNVRTEVGLLKQAVKYKFVIL